MQHCIKTVTAQREDADAQKDGWKTIETMKRREMGKGLFLQTKRAIRERDANKTRCEKDAAMLLER